MNRPLTVQFNHFRGYVGGNPTLTVDAESFEEVLNKIDEIYPGFKGVILRDKNTIRNSVAVRMYNREGKYLTYVREITHKFPDNMETIEIGLQDLGGG